VFVRGTCTSAADDFEADFTSDLYNQLEKSSAHGVTVPIEVVTHASTRGSFDPSNDNTRRLSEQGTSRNQDFGQAWDKWDGKEGQYLLLCLDGHGERGQDFSRTLAPSLESTLKGHLLLATDPLEAMKQSFVEVDTMMNKMSTSWGTEGACAALVLVRSSTCFVAHCGDCVVTLARLVDGKPKAIQLNDTHSPGKPGEKRRITSTGGRVMATRADPDTMRIWPGGSMIVSSGTDPPPFPPHGSGKQQGGMVP